MKLRPLIDEVPTHQDIECAVLGVDFLNDCDDDEEDAPGFGADPFDILAHKQEQGELQ